MFSWVSKQIGNVVESVAPIFRTNAEQFNWAWKKVDEEYNTIVSQMKVDVDDPLLLSRSGLVDNMNMMLESLAKEEEERDEQGLADSGPCVEYLLQKGVLDGMVALGMPDRPPGMRCLVTKALDAILNTVRNNILPNMTVHGGVRQLINVSVSRGDMNNPKYKTALISLLHTIFLKIRDEPNLADIFFEVNPKNGKQDFPFLSILMSCMNGTDQDSMVAKESVLYCTSLPNDRIAAYILSDTDLCSQLIRGLSETFGRMKLAYFGPSPPSSSANNPMSASFSSKSLHTTTLTSNAYFNTIHGSHFLDFLSYFDTTCQSAPDQMTAILAKGFLHEFLTLNLQPILTDMDEARALWATELLRVMLEQLSSAHLITALVDYVTANESPKKGPQPSPPSSPLSSSSPPLSPLSSPPLVSLLIIKRIDCMNEKLANSTLSLFNSILSLHNPLVIDRLVLCSISKALHIVKEERKRNMPHSAFFHLPTIDRSYILSPLPDLGEIYRDSDYEDYLIDAQADCQLWMEVWDRFLLTKSVATRLQPEETPGKGDREDRETKTEEKEDNSSDPEFFNDFQESPLILQLLNRLENVYTNSFQTNMLLTSVLAHLAHCPDYLLHTYLLDPTLPTVSTARKLLQVLGELWNQGKRIAEKTDNFEKQLAETVRNLNSSGSSPVSSAENQRFFQGLIILKEFVKELLAISQAKSNVFNLYKLANVMQERAEVGEAGEVVEGANQSAATAATAAEGT